MRIEWEIPLKTVSEANSCEHWAVKSRRHKAQQWVVKASFGKHVPLVYLPCVLTLTRLSPRLLDDDNLLSAFKHIRDELSECLLPELCISRTGRALKGRADSDRRITWLYAQEKRREPGIRIQIDFVKDCPLRLTLAK